MVGAGNPRIMKQMGRPVHRLRHLQALLRQEQEFVNQPKGAWISASFLLATGGIVLALVLFRFSLAIILMMGVLSPFIFVFLAGLLARHREDLGLGWSPEGAQAMAELRGFDRDSSLEDRMDPEVGDAVNSACEAYRDIHSLLKSPEWANAQGEKREARLAAEGVLGKLCDDALVISLAGVRSKGQRRDVFKKRMADPAIKPPILQDLQQVRARLVDLREEIRLASQAGNEVNIYTDAIERIGEIRRAEEELRDSIRA